MCDLNRSALQKYTDMAVEKPEIDTLIDAAGQAGVAMSKLGVHLILGAIVSPAVRFCLVA
ncbi:hypothetical protein [Pseudomonas borbori]|uniref:Uncharacterized protein n=1 Tax=Pseudomonas borbori TaxID=289003 RepID=A0A1I5M8N3_9PSED|nr:hypothetical protein [Pseudomonas borbori]SFP05952.1 hypothetical protein SAMN05216190_104147 [Pseudomonas borbori]